ncbi:hypothetical protein, partial [Pseudomonas aeruginosa]|uniref:hypothetical protein n=1 Tax=Pseudomonas aeruginosa TaxID=287 RepID=UPI003F4EC2AB
SAQSDSLPLTAANLCNRALVPTLEGQLEADAFMLRPTADGIVHRLLLECVHPRQTPYLALIQLHRLRARLSVFQQPIQLGSPLFQ